jgi:glutamyl-tRNA synthetase
MQGMVRTRIAPSPTGQPHIGTIYQAMFDYVFARKYDGKFIVRIEDTDRVRFVEGAEEAALDALDWFGLFPDESVRKPQEGVLYRQSERKDAGIYEEYIKILLNKPLPMLGEEKFDENNQKNYCAYYCFCTKERLDELRNQQQKEKKTPRYDKHCLSLSRSESLEKIKNISYVIRLNVPSNTPIKFDDWLSGEIEVTSNDVDDQVLIKADGFPTYHFAVVVDDELMKISHVFRGKEWLPSTPKHIILYYYFGWVRPIFVHVPLILNMDGKGKLSKRHGHSSVAYYKEEGFLSDAIINYLINIVWNHPDGKEFFTIEEFGKLLQLNQIGGAVKVYANDNHGIKEIISIGGQEKFITSQGPRFDLSKLTWMNQQYIQNKTDEELKKLIIDFYPKAKELSEKTLNDLMPLVKSRMEKLKDFEQLTDFFFTPPESLVDEKEKDLAKALSESLSVISSWNHDMIFEAMKKILQDKGIRMPALYKVLTGKERGLPLPQVLEILGKEKTQAILANASK